MKILKDGFRADMERIKRELTALQGVSIHVGILGNAGSDILMIAGVHEYGATISAKNVKHLAIPLNIARNEDTVTTQVGVKGDVAYNENANESGTITVTLMGTSSSLPYVRSLALKRKEVSVMIVDANDSASVNVAEERCRVIKPPDITRAKEIGSVSVSIFVPSLNYR